jgi:hypothetical protein
MSEIPKFQIAKKAEKRDSTSTKSALKKEK